MQNSKYGGLQDGPAGWDGMIHAVGVVVLALLVACSRPNPVLAPCGSNLLLFVHGVQLCGVWKNTPDVNIAAVTTP